MHFVAVRNIAQRAHAHTHLPRWPFLLLQCLSGTISLAMSGHPTPCHPSYHFWNAYLLKGAYSCGCGWRVRMCMGGGGAPACVVCGWGVGGCMHVCVFLIDAVGLYLSVHQFTSLPPLPPIFSCCCCSCRVRVVGECVRLCVCVCVHACMRACVCACVCVS